MKPFIVRRDSLHYRLAVTYGPLHPNFFYHDDVDFCRYVRAVIQGAIKVALLTVIACLVAVGIGDTLALGAASLVAWSLISPNWPAGATLVVLSSVICVCLFAASFMLLVELKDTLIERMQARREVEAEKPKQPRFLVQAYRSLKEKYCLPVKLADQVNTQDSE